MRQPVAEIDQLARSLDVHVDGSGEIAVEVDAGRAVEDDRDASSQRVQVSFGHAQPRLGHVTGHQHQFVQRGRLVLAKLLEHLRRSFGNRTVYVDQTKFRVTAKTEGQMSLDFGCPDCLFCQAHANSRDIRAVGTDASRRRLVS